MWGRWAAPGLLVLLLGSDSPGGVEGAGDAEDRGVREGAVVLVSDGEAQIRVLVRTDAPPVTRFATEELIRVVARSAGVELPLEVVPPGVEPAPSPRADLWVGRHSRPTPGSPDPDTLPPEAFWLLRTGQGLWVAGNEGTRGWEGPDGGPPLFPRAALRLHHDFFGTLFGVHELLREAVGVTWLWPGKDGEVIPRREVVEVLPRPGVTAPALSFRTMGRARTYRWSVLGESPPPRMTGLGFSPSARAEYGVALELFLKRHGLGGEARRPGPGHRFQDWPARFGASRPDWFLHPGAAGWAAGMCLPAPGLLAALLAEGPDWRGVLDVSEMDGPVGGEGAGCDAWDAPGLEPPPHPPEVMSYYGPPWLSQRYATFWHKVARGVPPEVTLATLLYMNYLPAPPDPPALGVRVYGEFVPFAGGDADFFPMGEATREWLLDQWDGWRDTGMRLAYRPNHLHDGYALPWMAPRQFAQLFQELARREMEGAYFDSLTGQWAAQGPWLYLHLRLLNHPESDPEAVLAEYFQAFGPASPLVERYFHFWERYTEGSRLRVAELDFGGNRWDRFQMAAHEVIPEEVLLQARRLLTAAADAAAADPSAAARVQFLQLGWVHARLTLALSRAMAGQGGDLPTAHACLARFRRDSEARFVGDFDTLADKESRHWSFTFSGEGPTFPLEPTDPLVWTGSVPAAVPAGIQDCLALLN